MDIIAYKNFKKNCLCGYIEIQRGEEFDTILYQNRECVCTPEKQLITFVYSKNYVDHFARNDDGNGLIRGPLAYLITHTQFTDNQLDTIFKQWGRYLKEDTSITLFRNFLYEAKIETLYDIVKSLNLEGRIQDVQNNI